MPTGGPVSPIMSFYAYRPLWEQIHKLTLEEVCDFTIYVDDLTISGKKVREWLIKRVEYRLKSYRLQPHPEKKMVYRAGTNKEVTGVVINKSGKLLLPRRLYIKKQKLIVQRQYTKSDEEKVKLEQRITGIEQYQKAIEKHNSKAMQVNLISKSKNYQ